MADYDKYYTTEDLFGAPYPELIDFFKAYEPKGKVLDLAVDKVETPSHWQNWAMKLPGSIFQKPGSIN